MSVQGLARIWTPSDGDSGFWREWFEDGNTIGAQHLYNADFGGGVAMRRVLEQAEFEFESNCSARILHVRIRSSTEGFSGEADNCDLSDVIASVLG